MTQREVKLGESMPSFEMRATDGKTYSDADFGADILVMMFICNHCPYVVATRQRMIDLANEFSDVDFAAICSNDAERYPDDSFERMAEDAEKFGYPFPYLHDETQKVAVDFGALCTPDIFVYDKDRKLAYRGRIDDNWRNESAVTSRELHAAISALRNGERPSEVQHPSVGCSIKWKY